MAAPRYVIPDGPSFRLGPNDPAGTWVRSGILFDPIDIWNRNPHATARLRSAVPSLAAVKQSDLTAATGLTNASCSRIRSGVSVPHPRHGAALAGLR